MNKLTSTIVGNLVIIAILSPMAFLTLVLAFINFIQGHWIIGLIEVVACVMASISIWMSARLAMSYENYIRVSISIMCNPLTEAIEMLSKAQEHDELEKHND